MFARAHCLDVGGVGGLTTVEPTLAQDDDEAHERKG